MDEGAVKLKF
jgi:hypothetical protein